MANWTVSNYYKKCVEEHEKFYKGNKHIIRKTGWRFGRWNVTTTDDNPPKFDWSPDNDPLYATVDINNCTGPNIEEIEFLETWDGCWEDYEFDDDTSEEEQEAIMNIIEEEGFWELENQGWYPEDCQCYIVGPIQVDDESGNTVKIICSDEEGNTIDYKEVELDSDEEITFEELSEINPESEQDVIDSMPAWPFPEPKEQTPLPAWPFPTGLNDKEIK